MNLNENEPIPLKIILLGDSGVGKKTLIYKYSYQGPPKSENNYCIKNINLDEGSFKLQLWHPEGQDRYKSVPPSYYRYSHAAIFIFDIANKISFDSLTYWIAESDTYSKDAIRVLVGNKSDLLPEVSTDFVLNFATLNKMAYFETSSLKDYNLQELFLHVVLEVKYKFFPRNTDEEYQRNLRGSKLSSSINQDRSIVHVNNKKCLC